MSNDDQTKRFPAGIALLVACVFFITHVALHIRDHPRDPTQVGLEGAHHQLRPSKSGTLEAAACAAAEIATSADPTNHDKLDLCAQYRAAVAAEMSARYASLQTWIGGLGFFAVLVTLWFNIGATKAATESATAAREGLQNTRAWLVFLRFDFHQTTPANAEAGWLLRMVLVNVGKSPAFVQRYGFVQTSKPNELPDNTPLDLSKMPPGEDIVGEGHEMHTNYIYVSNTDLEAISDNNGFLALRTIVEYRHAFSNETKMSEMWYRMIVNGEVQTPQGNTFPNFEFRRDWYPAKHT